MVTYWRRNLRPLQAQCRWWALALLLLMLKCRSTNMEIVDETTVIECPVINENSACPCYKFEDGELMATVIGNKFNRFRATESKLNPI